eukprot:TRINITY_DN10461_c0_g3_i1.p1 TRINITY_DN10461_c0_g3~~TRINITY_DN10461_c0_g3_i1.p1  ORF type:complete len:162 (-),score=21.27 TRINITY_DN10461_c0_g3_i1:369-854(-)
MTNLAAEFGLRSCEYDSAKETSTLYGSFDAEYTGPFSVIINAAIYPNNIGEKELVVEIYHEGSVVCNEELIVGGLVETNKGKYKAAMLADVLLDPETSLPSPLYTCGPHNFELKIIPSLSVLPASYVSFQFTPKVNLTTLKSRHLTSTSIAGDVFSGYTTV